MTVNPGVFPATAERQAHDLQMTAEQMAHTCRYYAQVFYAGETPWFYSRYFLGIPSVLLASLGAAISFLKMGESATISGILSVIVAALSGVYLTLDPMARALQFHNAAAAYEVLYHDLKLFLRIHLSDPGISLEIQRIRLDALHARLVSLTATRPPVAARAYRRANKVIAGKLFGEVKDDAAIGTDLPPYAIPHGAEDERTNA